MTVYRTLLGVLPRSFRDEFADEMTQVFGDQLKRSHGASRVTLWLTTIFSVMGLSLRLRLDHAAMDVKHAARALYQQKTFTITAVATLALAMGPATAVFSLASKVLLDPLPGANLANVVFAWPTNATRAGTKLRWSELNFLDHQERQRGFAALAAYTETSATFGGELPRQVTGTWVSPEMFDVLGLSPARGRGFEPADTVPGGPPTIILGHDFARARFGEREAIGQTLTVDGRTTTVIGVLPPGFRFPAGTSAFWQPIVIDRASSSRGMSYLSVIGRLDDGVSPAAVAEHMNQVAADLEQDYPSTNAGYRVALTPAADEFTGDAQRLIAVMGLAALAIFVLACTNIASLMVVRIAGRQTEFAVRAALGASRARLSRHLLVEHLLLAGGAAAAALVVSAGLLGVLKLTALVPGHQVERAAADGAVLAFLLALMAVTSGVIGGLASRRATGATGAAGPRTQSSSRDVVRLRQALVSVEVAAAVVLLTAAALLLQSAARVMAVESGFRSERVVTFQVTLPPSRYPAPDTRLRFIESVVAQLTALPGVEGASSAGYAPMTGMRATRRFAIDGRPLPPPGAEALAIDLPADPAYAGIMGLRLIDGRWIDERDRADAPPVVVISESFARQHFPGERAVGHRLHYYSGRPDAPLPPKPEIVGVVSDVRQFAMDEAPDAQMYIPHAQRPWSFVSFFVHTSGDPRSVAGSVPAAVRAVDPDRPVEDLRTLSELLSDSTANRRALSGLLAIGAIVALLIAGIGVYGVTSAATAERKRELAIRAAVGANRAGLLRLVVRQGLTAAVIGVALGVAGSALTAGVLDGVLFEVKARDPLTLAVVGTGLLLVCLVATYLPARRALTANPAAALRAD